MEGVAQRPDGTPYVFGYLPLFLLTDWMVVTDGTIHTLVDRAGGEVTTYDCSADLAKQISIMEDLAVKELDGVILHPVDSIALGPSADVAWEAGIPIFNYDHKTESEHIVCFSTHDQVHAGRVAGEWLVNKAEAEGKQYTVYELWGAMGMEGSERRHQGFHEAVDPSPLVDVIESPDTFWAIDNAMQFVMEAFPAHPELNAILDHGSMLGGAIEGLRTIDRLYPVGNPDHVVALGIDELPDTLNAIRDGYADGCSAHSPWEECDAVTRAMLAYACCGLAVPSDVVFTSYFVDNSNIDDPRWGAPAIWGDQFQNEPNFDQWPILDFPAEYGIITPTVDMKESGY